MEDPRPSKTTEFFSAIGCMVLVFLITVMFVDAIF